jgi:hypothetical protein
MNRTTHSNANAQGNAWIAGDMLEQEAIQSNKKRWWWHRMTMPPELTGSSTFVQREASRRARLLSTITFFLILIDLILIPATLRIPNHYVVFLCLFVFGICVIASFLNRANKVLFASLLLVSMLELTLVAIVASTIPFDVTNLPLYDLLTIAILFAASLLPSPYIFVTALANMLFVSGELFLQRTAAGLATPALQHYLQTSQFYAALARPVALQIIAGAVIFLWVRSTSQAIARADRAEMVAKLEHDLAEQKKQLEEGIKQILQTHAEVANGNFDARTPMTRDDSLWPLANALNTLLTRFQRSYKAEKEIQHLQMMTIPSLVNKIQAAEQSHQSLPIFSRTSTSLDPLLLCLSGKNVNTPTPLDAHFRE